MGEHCRFAMRSVLAILLALTLWVPGASLAEESPAQRLAQAIAYRTVSHQDLGAIDYAEFRRFHAFLRASFPRVFARLEVDVVNDYSLLLRWRGSDRQLPPVLFTAHMDVVPIEPGTLEDWSHPPFAGVIDGGRIHGRGALDDKQGLMGLLEAAEGLLAEGHVPRRDIVFAFGHDEEIGGLNGARELARLMEQRNWHFAWMIDEGGMVVADNPLLPERPVAMINVAEKGYLTLILVTTGEGGHSSRPPRISTIGRLSAALARIEDNPFEPRLPGPVAGMLRGMAPYMSQPERFVFNNLWLTGPFVARRMSQDRLTNSFVRTTTALTMFNAGIKENVVPQRAEARVNFRLLPGDTPEQLIQRIEAIVDDPAITITAKDWDRIPPVADHEAQGFRVIAAAVEPVYPEAVIVPSMLTATTDTRHYIDVADNHYRFRGMLIEAGQASSVHGTGEYITIESYRNSVAVAHRMLELASQPPRDAPQSGK